MREFTSSRSRQETGLRCSRARFWASEWNGTGLESSRASVPLATGGATHQGLAHVLTRVLSTSCHPEGFDAKNIHSLDTIELAVKVALDDYDSKCKDRGFQLKELESASQTYNEQRALTEALVRLGGLVVIPRLLETYEVLEVEKQDEVLLHHEDDEDDYGKWDILWKSIPDALLRNRESGELFLLSWKTTSEYSSQKDDDARVDVQGQSEAWAWTTAHPDAGEIRGIQMVYLAKGPRRKEELPDGSWIQKTQNPLIYGYGKDLGGLAPEYASSLFWKCLEPHLFKWAKGGTCPGGKGHKRGDEWKGFPVWESMGIAKWIEMIQGGKVQGGENILESLFAIPMVHYRSPGKLESWLLQAQSLEIQRAKDLQALGDNPTVGDLDRCFPQGGMWTGSCTNWFWSRCGFFELCHGPSHVQADPVGSGVYQIRSKREEVKVVDNA